MLFKVASKLYDLLYASSLFPPQRRNESFGKMFKLEDWRIYRSSGARHVKIQNSWWTHIRMWGNKLEKPKNLVSLLHWCFNWQVRASTHSSSSTSIKGLCYFTTVSNLKMCKSLESPLAPKLLLLSNSGHSFWKSFIDFFLALAIFSTHHDIWIIQS